MATAARSATGAGTAGNALILLVGAAIFLNYVDRGALAVGAPKMKAELGLTATEFGLAVSAFFWVYAPLNMFIGRLCDRFSVYWVFGAGVVLWAVSTTLTSLAAGLVSLIVLRVFLGIGESVAFPGSSKMITAHVPASGRGLANGIIGAGLALGPAVGTLAGGLMTAAFGWRVMFLVFGLVTLVWLLPWGAVVRRIPKAERADRTAAVPISKVASRWSLWAMGIAHFFNVYGFYFLLTWLPLFLVQSRGFTIQQMSFLATIAQLAFAVSVLALGWFSDVWTRSGRDEAAVRRWTVVAGHVVAAICIVGILVSESLPALIFWLALAGASYGTSTPSVYGIAQMFAGPRASGTWVGVQSALGNTAGFVMPVVTGIMIDQTGSYAGGFYLAAAVVGLGALWWAWGVPKIRQIELG
jgi:MFS family permease